MTEHELSKRLRITAFMIEMGEMIAWGSDSALMREAANLIDKMAAKPVPDDVSAWQPIDTAPKDETSVLIWRAGDMYPGVAYQSGGRWFWSASGGWAGYPARWTHLPPALVGIGQPVGGEVDHASD